MPLSPTGDAMKRRSREGGGLTKTRRRKALEPKRRNAPGAVARSNPPPTAEETEVARLGPDRDEAMGQLSAASEVLKVITSSPGDLKRVFEAILENATRLCEAKFGALFGFGKGRCLFALVLCIFRRPSMLRSISRT